MDIRIGERKREIKILLLTLENSAKNLRFLMMIRTHTINLYTFFIFAPILLESNQINRNRNEIFDDDTQKKR